MKQDPEVRGRVDISDLNADPVVIWQHTHYRELALLMGFGLPSLVSGLFWNDYLGGLIYAGILRCFFVQQATFCVNSLAHWLGDATFSDKISPRDHVFTALVSMGEGYHNFHHEFPADYRNAIAWHQYDPTKWFIWVCKQVGLASNLKQFRQNEIEKGRLQQEQKRLDREQTNLDQRKEKLQWPVPLERLPVLEWEEYREQAKSRALVDIAGVVHDVRDFIQLHPGGEALIKSGIGKDATAMFNGGVYNRNQAFSILRSSLWNIAEHVKQIRTRHTTSSPQCASLSSVADVRLKSGSGQVRRFQIWSHHDHCLKTDASSITTNLFKEPFLSPKKHDKGIAVSR